jgi:hypothetical protein
MDESAESVAARYFAAVREAAALVGSGGSSQSVAKRGTIWYRARVKLVARAVTSSSRSNSRYV